MARRLISRWFPSLASDTSRRPVERAFALIKRSGRADQLHCLNREAAAKGLHRGWAVADTGAICPNLMARGPPICGGKTARAVLRRWVSRSSLLVAGERLDGLVANIFAVAHLFGGEDGLWADLDSGLARAGLARAGLARAGLATAAAIAGTRGAAHALARHGGDIVPEGGIAEGIARLGRIHSATLNRPQVALCGIARRGCIA